MKWARVITDPALVRCRIYDTFFRWFMPLEQMHISGPGIHQQRQRLWPDCHNIVPWMCLWQRDHEGGESSSVHEQMNISTSREMSIFCKVCELNPAWKNVRRTIVMTEWWFFDLLLIPIIWRKSYEDEGREIQIEVMWSQKKKKKTKEAHSYQRLGVCVEIKRLLNASLLLI